MNFVLSPDFGPLYGSRNGQSSLTPNPNLRPTGRGFRGSLSLSPTLTVLVLGIKLGIRAWSRTMNLFDEFRLVPSSANRVEVRVDEFALTNLPTGSIQHILH